MVSALSAEDEPCAPLEDASPPLGAALDCGAVGDVPHAGDDVFQQLLSVVHHHVQDVLEVHRLGLVEQGNVHHIGDVDVCVRIGRGYVDGKIDGFARTFGIIDGYEQVVESHELPLSFVAPQRIGHVAPVVPV